MPERKNRDQLSKRPMTAGNKSPADESDQPDLSTEEPDKHQLLKILADETVDELEVIVFDEEGEADFVVGADDEAVIEQMQQYTEDDEVLDDFAERQQLNAGSKELLMRLHQNTAESPELTGGDIDAGWDESDVGDETVGGTAPTPDQDIVDELGKAVGLTYDDDEPLGIQEKMAERERNRWELDPKSARDEEYDLEDEDPDRRDDLDDEDDFDEDDEDDYDDDDLDDEDDFDDDDDLDLGFSASIKLGS